MGLFDSVLSSQQKTQVALGPAEAFVAICMIAIGIDGYSSNEEIQVITNVLGRMQLFRSYPNDVLLRMISNLARTLQHQGYDALFTATIAALPHDLAETAFAIATDVALADGVVTSAEENFLTQLCYGLGVSENVARQIIEVMVIKNRG